MRFGYLLLFVDNRRSLGVYWDEILMLCANNALTKFMKIMRGLDGSARGYVF